MALRAVAPSARPVTLVSVVNPVSDVPVVTGFSGGRADNAPGVFHGVAGVMVSGTARDGTATEGVVPDSDDIGTGTGAGAIELSRSMRSLLAASLPVSAGSGFCCAIGTCGIAGIPCGWAWAACGCCCCC